MAEVVQTSKELVKTSYWCARLKKLRVYVIFPGFIYRRFFISQIMYYSQMSSDICKKKKCLSVSELWFVHEVNGRGFLCSAVLIGCDALQTGSWAVLGGGGIQAPSPINCLFWWHCFVFLSILLSILLLTMLAFLIFIIMEPLSSV